MPDKSRDNRGATLIEILVVIAILSIMAGAAAISISLIYSRDTDKCARLIDIGLEETRMSSLSQEGIFDLYVDADNHLLTIEATPPGPSPISAVIKQTELPDRVAITVRAEGGLGAVEGEKLMVRFDKSTGKLSAIAIDDVTIPHADYNVVRINMEDMSGTKESSILLVKITGKHYID